VVGVLPGVVDEAGAKVGHGEAVGGLEDLEGSGFEGGEAGIGFEDFGGALVLGFDPGHGLVAVDVFEPDVFVGGEIGGAGGGGGLGGCGRRLHESSYEGKG
jgi:hypothetical protein